MPSLRRSSSTPLVRSSPYPTSLSLSSAGAQNLAAAHRPRRVGSATENGRRRVLADIDWWTVVDGQSEQGEPAPSEPELVPVPVREQAQAVVATLLGSESFAPAIEVAAPSASDILSDTASDGSSEALALSVPFAALTLSSVGPATLPHSRRGHARQDSASSSNSSITSTPETSPLLFADMFSDACFASNEILDASDSYTTLALPFGTRQCAPSAISAGPMSRSVSFGGFASESWADDRFGDMHF